MGFLQIPKHFAAHNELYWAFSHFSYRNANNYYSHCELLYSLLKLGMARNFGMVGPCVTRCEQCEDGKMYVERVRRSEQGFEHLTEGEYMVVSQDSYTFLCFTSRCSSLSYSSISSWTSQGNGRILALCLYFHFCASLPALSYLLSSPF